MAPSLPSLGITTKFNYFIKSDLIFHISLAGKTRMIY